jgi:hypothetical protein
MQQLVAILFVAIYNDMLTKFEYLGRRIHSVKCFEFWISIPGGTPQSPENGSRGD